MITLRPARSRTPSEVTTATLQDSVDATAYEELDSDEDDHRDLRSGVVVSKIQGRPLPAPPRPPRSRRDRHVEDGDEATEFLENVNATTEAFASTQTDPLPDDMVIEEEVTQAKLVVSPSRSGSQILVSTERIPSPTNILLTGSGRSSSQIIVAAERVPSPTMHFETSEFSSDPPERSVSAVFERRERTPSPVRRATAPIVPPLPTQQSLYHDDLEEIFPSRETKSRSKSPSLPRQMLKDVEDYERETEARLQSSLSERIRIEEELEQARMLRSALMSSEPLKIASLEVGDLRVDRLSVSNLEAHKISASEIDALVVSATELSNTGETPEPQPVELHPTLLRELIAIRSQLELVNSTQEAPKETQLERVVPQRRHDEVRPREIAYSTVQSSQPVHLQLDQVSRSMETRAIFSSAGSSRESSPQPNFPPTIPSLPTVVGVAKEPAKKAETEIKTEQARPSSRSRSPSPGRTSPDIPLRQTASPVKSLPPVISVTPDSPDVVRSPVESSEVSRPQRAVISFAQESEQYATESMREPSPPRRPASPPAPPTSGGAQYIAFSTSQIPPQFFSLASPAAPPPRLERDEPGVSELGRQLFVALRLASKRAVRHFVGHIVNRIGQEETDTKIREIELALCALLLIIIGLLIVCFAGPRTITHHHHWDYFNPPRM